MEYRITGLDAREFAHLAGLSDAELARHRAVRYVCDAKPGFPCRVTLEDAEPGDEVLLVNYEHQPADSPYRASHAIYIRTGRRNRFDDVNTIPGALRDRLLSVRAFDVKGFIVDADVDRRPRSRRRDRSLLHRPARGLPPRPLRPPGVFRRAHRPLLNVAVSMSENGEPGPLAGWIMPPCCSTPTSVTARCSPTTRASTGASSWACRTTRVYCRPVCTARTPHRENCRYFPSAAAAEAGGFRPCLRCRPELAPGYATVDANRRLAQSAAGLIEDGRLTDARLPDVAGALGVTDRHLRRVFQEEFGVSPIEYAQTQRLLLAKRLLTDTDMAVLDVAMASGFASLRRFNHLFRTRYRLTPAELRRRSPARAPGDRLSFDLAYRPPYDWEAMLAFLEYRAIAGVEAVAKRAYLRSMRLGPHRHGGDAAGESRVGWITVAPSKRRSALRVTVSASLAGVIPQLLARVKHLFDLACHPDEIATTLGKLAEAHPGLRLPGAVDGFEVAVRAILGQQVTVKAASTIAARFAAAFGEPIDTPHAAITALFPTPAAIAALEPSEIAKHGIIASRARAIVALAQAVDGGRIRLEPSAPVEATVAALEELPGIGPWTAQYIAMRALAWPDAFPHPDVAVLKAMKRKGAAAARPRRVVASLARLRRSAPVEIPGEPGNDPLCPLRIPARHHHRHRQRRQASWSIDFVDAKYARRIDRRLDRGSEVFAAARMHPAARRVLRRQAARLRPAAGAARHFVPGARVE